MNKTKIEWTDYTWNPMTGCLNNCPYCYARRIATRFRGTKAFPNGFEPTAYPTRFLEPKLVKKPAKIFVGSMGELFGDWIFKGQYKEYPDSGPLLLDLQYCLFGTVKECPQHIFQFLTSCPWNLWRWNPWPGNAWVGATAIDSIAVRASVTYLKDIEATVRYLSLEPLLGELPGSALQAIKRLDWLIVGAQTNPYRPPKPEWVDVVVKAADEAGIPIFLKNNLKPIMGDNLRQEFPGN